jgi:hypothetical protein
MALPFISEDAENDVGIALLHYVQDMPEALWNETELVDVDVLHLRCPLDPARPAVITMEEAVECLDVVGTFAFTLNSIARCTSISEHNKGLSIFL